jgi:DNA-damage-inducible protein J
VLSVSAKVPETERTEFYRIADEIGTSPSNAIRMFISAFNRKGGFPFDPSNPSGFNQETLDAMRDAAEGKNLSPAYSNAAEMRAALDAEV